jgi:hypothetical protein
MHEADAVRAAIRHAVADRDAFLRETPRAEPPGDAGAFRHLELEIIDPARATPEAVGLLAPPILEEQGLGRVSFDVFVRAVPCSMCGRMSHAGPEDPTCRSCGATVPCTEGAAIEARWTRPIPVAAGDRPAHDSGSHLADHQHRTHVPRVTR